jgi:predicted dithiol-disulfide oxidoreductase (DUF899 family)
MTHTVVSREAWLGARVELLKEEKEHTRRGDELARKRQELPWVRLAKEYRFDTEEGPATLAELFRGRSQLLVYHFMFGPDYKVGCPHCSSIADGFNGVWDHLANHDVMLCAISRAPIAKLQAFKQRMGWKFPWVSSGQTDFNSDFNVSFSPEQQRAGAVLYNYQQAGAVARATGAASEKPSEYATKLAESVGTDWPTYIREMPGMSAFAREGNTVYHTYSAFARGLDAMWGVYQWLDRAPLGRNEHDPWIRRHDEYETASAKPTSCCGSRAS